MKNFVLIGVGGYIAPRHLKAIRDTGNNLLAALDKHDSVGILDSYFPNANFFTEFERFDRHCEKLKMQGIAIDYVVVCSPNYLHDAHIRFGLRLGAEVICEKPIVLNPWNIDALLLIEKQTKSKVHCILQLRLHPAIIALKKRIDASVTEKKFDINLQYITARGNWYKHSWKGDLEKSGGIATNIGVHFFDMLLWIFGEVEESTVEKTNDKTAQGMLKLSKATVHWTLSIDEALLPEELKTDGKNTYRSLVIDNEAIDFSDGFSDLHHISYEKILIGEGFGLADSRLAIDLLSNIRK